MDPLSATASVIALFQAAKGIGKGVQFLRALRNVPAEFRELLDEVTTLQSVADHVHAASTEFQSFSSSTNDLAPALSKVDTGIIVSLKDDLVHIADELDSMCDRLRRPQQRLMQGVTEDGGRAERVSMFRWQAEKGNVAKLQQRARNTREHLSLCFAAFSSSQLHQQARLTSELKQQLFHSTQLFLQTQEQHHQNQQLLINILASLTQVNQRRLEDSLTPHTGAPSSITAARLPNASLHSHVAPRPAPVSMIRIPLSFHPRCSTSCTCQCHRLQTVQSPGLLSSWLGRVLLQGRATPFSSGTQCDIRTCKAKEQSSLKVTYTFPRWLLARSVELSLSMSSLTGAGSSLHLRIPRVLGKHTVWRAIAAGDIHWFQRSFAKKEIFPSDVDVTGRSLALDALIDGQYELAVFLASHGCDKHASDQFGRTAALTAKYLLTTHNVNGNGQSLLSALPLLERMASSWSESEGEVDYSVTTLAHDPIMSLQLSRRDIFGCSPLHWASIRGDSTAVHSLLQAGADPNAADLAGSTPLLKTFDFRCIQLLLEAGADPNLISYAGEIPIFHVFGFPEMVGLMLSHGANPCLPPTQTWASVLGRVANVYRNIICHDDRTRKWAASLDLLLETGFDIDLPEPQLGSMTPLMLAVVNRNAPLTELLIERGARFDSVADNLFTLFHFAAICTQLECIQILRQANISGIDPDRPNIYGLTPTQYLYYYMEISDDDVIPGEKRVTEEEYEAFMQLMEEIRERKGKTTWSGQVELGVHDENDETRVESKGIAQDSPTLSHVSLERYHRAGEGANRGESRVITDQAVSDEDNDEFYDAESEATSAGP